MEYRGYQHIERLGTSEVEGILNGEVYVYPKLDGTNGQAWSDGNTIFVGSHTEFFIVKGPVEEVMNRIMVEEE